MLFTLVDESTYQMGEGMKKIRFIGLLVMIIMMTGAVALPVEAAGLQGVQEFADEDSDIVLEELPALQPMNTGSGSVFEELNELQPAAAPAPWPYSPILDPVYTAKPSFIFTENPAATRYRIEVVNAYNAKVLYTFSGAPVCNVGYCLLSPDYPLKAYDISLKKGKYLWRVQARVDGKWEGYSDQVGFTVISPGFNNNFNANVGKWRSVTGKWVRVDPGYLKTGGVTGIAVSALQKNIFLDFDYSVKMKRKLTDAYQGVVVWGDPSSVIPQNGLWYSGVYFLFRNNQTYAIYQMKDGVLSTMKGYTYSPSIAGYGWNTLRVVADEPDLHFYINGEYHGYVTPTISNAGYVGITAYKNDNDLREPLLVDSAELVSSFPIFASLPLDPALRLDAALQIVEGME